MGRGIVLMEDGHQAKNYFTVSQDNKKWLV